MAINQDMLQGSWYELKGKVRQRWGELTSDELEQTHGKAEELIGLIQRKTGETREQISSFLEEASDRINSTAGRAADAVRAGADYASDLAHHAVERATDAARAGYGRAEQTVRHRPVESLAVSFGVGLITGVVVGLLARSK